MNAWKVVQLLGALALLVGVLLRVGGVDYGTLIASLGLLAFVMARAAVWDGHDWP